MSFITTDVSLSRLSLSFSKNDANTSTANNSDSDSDLRVINKKLPTFQISHIAPARLLKGLDDAQQKVDQYSIQLVSARI